MLSAALLAAYPALAPLCNKLPTGAERNWVGGVSLNLQAVLVAMLAQAHAHKLMVWVLPSQSELEQVHTMLEFAGIKVAVFAEWETLIYDKISPHPDIISERLALLNSMPKQGVLLLTAPALAQRIAPASYLLGRVFNIQVGQKWHIDSERKKLIAAGYRAVETVFDAGEFAVRGNIVDIFAMGQPQPIRIEMFDDDVESLRTFDVETQCSVARIDHFKVLPAHEIPLGEANAVFKERFLDAFDNAPLQKIAWYKDLCQGRAVAGMEYYLPLFYPSEAMAHSGHILAYLPDDYLLIHDAEQDKVLEQFYGNCMLRYNDRRHDIAAPILPVADLFMPVEKLNQLCNALAHGRLLLSANPVTVRAGAVNIAESVLPSLASTATDKRPLALLATFTAQYNGQVLLVAASAGRKEILKEALHKEGLDYQAIDNGHAALAASKISLLDAPLYSGLCLGEQLALITENELYSQRVIQSRRREKAGASSASDVVRNLAELGMDDPVVHIDHGIGRYAGLVRLTIDGLEQEFVQINYADEGKVYVPIANLHLMSRYSTANPELAPLHHLGGEKWSKEKTKALEKIHDVAAELLDIQARRASSKGVAFAIDSAAYAQFAALFAFEETPDQQAAITATLADMQSDKPMDRLVCGDVGFGKTEVAMRAAFVAAYSGKQVAVLVPTTLLAQQHFENFSDRFAALPIKIAVLSRFGSGTATQQTIAQIAAGQVDIVIGTHKLLQGDIKFANLGLMVIDEEHRFGVRDKERIKAMRANIDMLTLTATPIPRTLNMAFAGMRDLSIIATPPQRRLAVKTFVQERSDSGVKEALLREILRGGQVYYLHNDVDTIGHCADAVAALIPEARVGIAHGQMRERDLERVTQQFYHKQFNVLVCTTIIETGIDVPSANTIIIERADKLGLAQLHQLRGRVGRSHHQAYAYLFVPSLKAISRDAERRLDAITQASHLGAGFALATQDLEIRGAGELLGDEQSGNMHAIGFDLYMAMLNKATKALKNGKPVDFNEPLSLTADIHLGLSALIPDEYMGDVQQRLLLYKRISAADHVSQLEVIKVEMIDRFGRLPVAVQNLFAVHQIRLKAEVLGVKKITMGDKGGTVEFYGNTPVEAITIIRLIQQQPQAYKLDGGQRLKVLRDLSDSNLRLAYTLQLLELLEP